MSDKDELPHGVYSINGGPAFPWQMTIPAGSPNPIQGRVVPEGHVDNEVFPGMTLRDYFAGQALTRVYDAGGRYGSEGLKQCAEYCYRMADAMLAERSRS